MPAVPTRLGTPAAARRTGPRSRWPRSAGWSAPRSRSARPCRCPGRDRLAVEGAAVGHQEGGLVVDAAVDVHAAAVRRRDPRVVRAGMRSGSPKAVGFAMSRIAPIRASPRPSASATPGVSVPRAVGQVDELAAHVGERLVDRAGLVVVEQVRVNSVTPWVSSWPTTSSAAAKPRRNHLLPVPEGVLKGHSAADEQYRTVRVQRQAIVVEAVAAELLE